MPPTTHTPADILRQALVNKGLGTLPTTAGAWPIYAGHLPDKPDEAVCVYTTTGRNDGRIHLTGETIHHPGFQVRVRSTAYATAWAKAKAIQAALDGLLRYSVALDSVTYIIVAVTQRGGVLPLGQESNVARREQFTLNGTITLT